MRGLVLGAAVSPEPKSNVSHMVITKHQVPLRELCQGTLRHLVKNTNKFIIIYCKSPIVYTLLMAK